MRRGLRPGLAALGVSLLLAGCTHSGPYLSSSQDRKLYAELPAAEQTAIDSGILQSGMAPEKVRLAWGKPDQVQRTENGVSTRTEWIYLGTQWKDRQVWRPSMVDRYGRYWLEPATDRVGIQVVIGQAVFENDRLIAWEPASGRPR